MYTFGDTNSSFQTSMSATTTTVTKMQSALTPSVVSLVAAMQGSLVME